MRVLSYNIRLALDSSLGRIAQVIRSLSADLVCLQEVGCGWEMGEPVDMTAVLADSTGLTHSLFGPAIQRGRAQYGIAVLSRFPLALLMRQPLDRQEDEPRVALGCRVEAPGGPALLVTSHLSVVPGDRPRQFHGLTRLTLTLRGREPLPTLVVGDFNAPLGERAFKEAIGWMKLKSAARDALGETPPTYPAETPKLAIDHILVSREIDVIDAAVADEPGSDHLPVWADLRWSWPR